MASTSSRKRAINARADQIGWPIAVPKMIVLFVLLMHHATGIVGNTPTIPMLQATGSHYEIGFLIGQSFQSRIITAIQSDKFFNNKLLQYVETDEGSQQYKKYLATTKKQYPQYMEEINGMADGANITFHKLFLWNMKFEFDLILEHPPPGCSDLFLLRKDGGSIIGHTEDGPLILVSTGYMINATTEKGEQYLAYCYPGELCGNAFGYNYASRTIVTLNALYPKHINTSAIGRNFINRALLSKSYSEIVKTLKQVQCSSGFGVNVGSSREVFRPAPNFDVPDDATENITYAYHINEEFIDKDFELEFSVNNSSSQTKSWAVSSFEVSPNGVVETVYKSGFGYHFNQYLHSPGVVHFSDPSSDHRLVRIQSLSPPTDKNGILSILGDTHNTQFPVYRTGAPPDTIATVATALFENEGSLLNVYTGNPAHTEPIMVIPLH